MTQEDARALVDATFTKWWASLPESIRVMMPRAEIERLRDMVRERVGQAAKRFGRANPQVTPVVEWTRETTATPPRENRVLGWLARARSASAVVIKVTFNRGSACLPIRNRKSVWKNAGGNLGRYMEDRQGKA